MAARTMKVIGMMSGTSADGIDAALVEISGAPPAISAKLAGHFHQGFPAYLRERILRLANGAATTTADVSELNFLVGEQLGRAALAALKKWRVAVREVDLIGSHGQTIFHQGVKSKVQGQVRVPSTLQVGDISVIAARTGIPTIGDFRPADMAAGGQGAPLIPFADYLLYGHARRGRVALNIGGIANVTVIPAGARPREVFAFDTGPGNMIVDALVERTTHGRAAFDRDAKIALNGRTIPELLVRLMHGPYLRKKPPKTAGREQFGQAFAEGLLRWGKQHHAGPADLVRTATIFTSMSIADAFRRFVLPRTNIEELIVSGGGAHNPLMMAQLAASLPGIEVAPVSGFGVPPEAKEAFGFALLAYESFHGRPGNLPSATGAKHAAVLGKIAHAGDGPGRGKR
jgi:anhydro-N-acetylmuramic acid kinase